MTKLQHVPQLRLALRAQRTIGHVDIKLPFMKQAFRAKREISIWRKLIIGDSQFMHRFEELPLSNSQQLEVFRINPNLSVVGLHELSGNYETIAIIKMVKPNDGPITHRSDTGSGLQITFVCE
jgi:hypothetical protein